MTRADAVFALAAAVPTLAGALWAGPALADSQMHQSPLMERGSPEACDTLRRGRVQRGGYSWQFSCAGAGRAGAQAVGRPR